MFKYVEVFGNIITKGPERDYQAQLTLLQRGRVRRYQRGNQNP